MLPLFIFQLKVQVLLGLVFLEQVILELEDLLLDLEELILERIDHLFFRLGRLVRRLKVSPEFVEDALGDHAHGVVTLSLD